MAPTAHKVQKVDSTFLYNFLKYMEPATFSPIERKDVSRRCAVPGCNSRGKDLNISFHRFPSATASVNIPDYFGNIQKVNKLQAWKSAVKIQKVSGYSLVCSLHFKKDDYNFPDVPANVRKLKPNAVPSLNLPGKNNYRQNLAIERHNRLLKRSNNNQNLNIIANKKPKLEPDKNFPGQVESGDHEKITKDSHAPVCKEKVDVTCKSEESIEIVSEQSDILKSNEPECNFLFVECKKIEPVQSLNLKLNQVMKPNTSNLNNEICDQNLNLNCKIKKPPFIEHIKSDTELCTATGIESFKALETIVAIVKVVVKDRFEKDPLVMNTFDRVLLTFVKLKQNLSYSFLAILFNCVSREHCERIFCETVQILSGTLSIALLWPTREEIRKNIPLCFNGFEDVRVVLDCTEIFIEQPKNSCCQKNAYSHPEGCETVKFLTGVTPSGLFTFVSKAYGGRVSNSDIFEQSDLIKLLEPEDAIMVDQGFPIEEICEKNQWKCIKPPYLNKKKQFLAAQIIETTRIAKARVHIDKGNQRLKKFKILNSVMPENLIPYIDDIVKVICATMNLSSPILKDDEFFKV